MSVQDGGVQDYVQDGGVQDYELGAVNEIEIEKNPIAYVELLIEDITDIWIAFQICKLSLQPIVSSTLLSNASPYLQQCRDASLHLVGMAVGVIFLSFKLAL